MCGPAVVPDQGFLKNHTQAVFFFLFSEGGGTEKAALTVQGVHQ